MQTTPAAPGVAPAPMPAAAALLPRAPPKASLASTSKASRDSTSLPALPRADLEPQLFLEAFTARLMGLDRERFFQQPVDEAMAPNYNSIIKSPMCFSIMQQRTTQKHYVSWRAFCDDFDLICSNAKSYNTNKTLVHKAAAALQKKGHNLIATHDMELRKALGLLHPDAHMKAGMSTTMATAAPPPALLLPPALQQSLSAPRLSTDVPFAAVSSMENLLADAMQAAAGSVTLQEVNSEMDTSTPPSPHAQSLQLAPTDVHLTTSNLRQESLHSNSQVLLSNSALPGSSKRQTGISLAPRTTFLHEPLCPYISDTEAEEADLPPTHQQQSSTGSDQLLRLLTSQPLNTLLEHLRTTSTQMPYLNQPCHVHHQHRRRLSRATGAAETAGRAIHKLSTETPPPQEQPAASPATPHPEPGAGSASGTDASAEGNRPVLFSDMLSMKAPLARAIQASSTGCAAAAGVQAPRTGAPATAALSAEASQLSKSCTSSSIAWQCSWLELRMQELAEQQHRLECKLQLLQSPATESDPVSQPAAGMEIDQSASATPVAAAALSIEGAPPPADSGTTHAIPSLSKPLHMHASLASFSSTLLQPQASHLCLALHSMTPAAAPPTVRRTSLSQSGMQGATDLPPHTRSILNHRHINLNLPPVHQPPSTTPQSSQRTSHVLGLSHADVLSQEHPVSMGAIFPSLQQLESQICMMRARVQQDFKLELGRGIMHRQAGSLAARAAPVIPAGGHLTGTRPESHSSKKGGGGMPRTASVVGAGKGGMGQGLTVLTRLDSGTKRKRESLDEGSIPLLNHALSLNAGSAPIFLPKVRELSHLECAARLVASTGWLRAVLLDERNLANVPPEVAAVLLDDEGSSSEDTSDESFEARHAFMEAEEHKRYSLVVADKRRSKSSSNTGLTGKSGPGLKTPRGHRPEDHPFSPTTTFDAIAAVMAAGAPSTYTPFHAQQQHPLAWPHQPSVTHSQSADQLHLTHHQQQHIAAAQLQLQQQHVAALAAASAATNAGTLAHQPSQQQQHSLAIAASGGPKVALQRAVSRNIVISLPRSSEGTATLLHTPAATGTKPGSAPATLDSSRSHHAVTNNHHHHSTPASAQLFTPVPHRAPHMLQPPALTYSRPAVVAPSAGPHQLALGPGSDSTPHPASARNGVQGNGGGSSDGDDGMEAEEAVDREASDADAEDDSEEVMDEDDADVDLADLEHDAHGSGVRKRAGGSHKKIGSKNRVSGSPRGRAAVRAGTAAGPPAMPRRSSGVVPATGTGVVTRGREGH